MEEFYAEDPQITLFEDASAYLRTHVDDLEQWVKRRLEEVFPAVSHPLRFPRGGAPRYSFFFAVSNLRIAQDILRSADNLP